MTTEFDTDTALVRGEGGWHGTVTDRWSIRPGHANGGYIASFLIRAMVNESPQPDPLTMTTHYLERPAVDAPVLATVEVLREGRSHAFLQSRLVQEDRAIAVALATFGRRRDGGPEMAAPMPDVPGVDEATPQPPMFDMSFRDRFDTRFPPVYAPSRWTRGGPAETGAWTRLVDRRLDDLAVPLFMDAFVPAIFASFLGGMAPTIELTVHWRGRPTAEWHFGLFRSRFLTGGYVEEDGELWGDDGVLVAQSRQLARFTPPD